MVKRKVIKKTFLLILTTLFLAGTAVAVTGCNTVEGAGKDFIDLITLLDSYWRIVEFPSEVK